ncbi:MAG: DNA cytosine methyltransferase [Pseudochelatococcus sp.]|jgi:DNA (cytosine-5)-methyltransferase 1|uniref:DNA cytosine methyltransferase n=1 Tax=Pseudochelatococcus sp. TaxID=2020869 RepID=UPI003D8F287F
MKSIELFAGAGGLGMGLHEAGFHPLQVVEWDRDSCDTLRDNKTRGQKLVRDWPLTEGDVRDVGFKAFEGNLDLVSGGPPCQPFSLGGKHGAYSDARDMFPQAIRAVREARPRAFLFENVKGLTREAFRNYFEYIRLQLEHPEVMLKSDETWTDHLVRLERHHTRGRRSGLNYQVVTRVLNAANYGVPQRRERVVFVGFRDDLHVSWSFPEGTHSLDALLWEQVRANDYWERHEVARKDRKLSDRAIARGKALREKPSSLPWRTVRDAIRDLPDPETRKASTIPNHRFQAGARSYTGHTGSPFDEPAKTLKAGVHGVPGGENMLARADGSVRYFTIRESARLQTFPDDYLFHGSWTESMRQLGNAVPVQLARRIGEDVAKHLMVAA